VQSQNAPSLFPCAKSLRRWISSQIGWLTQNSEPSSQPADPRDGDVYRFGEACYSAARSFLIKKFRLLDRTAGKLAALRAVKCRSLTDYTDFYLRLTMAKPDVDRLDGNAISESAYLRQYMDALPDNVRERLMSEVDYAANSRNIEWCDDLLVVGKRGVLTQHNKIATKS
jgi:hypothetical protein